MRRYLGIGIGGFLLVSVAFVILSISKETPSPFIEMEVKGVSLDAIGQAPVVILADKEGKKALLIWIGILEADAIDRELRNISPPRPMTHDLLYSILGQAQMKVKEVKIIDLKNNTYYAKLFLTVDKKLIEIDARPSDAIIIALKSKAPILILAAILDAQGITLDKSKEPDLGKHKGDRYGIRIQELTPPLASHFNFKGQKGVLVSEVLSGSPSEVSGIKTGDIITQINLKEVGNIQEFEEVLEALKGKNSV
ncbi:MAG: bifunctional nuclease domain-containing protein, partial [Thermodesulfobacteriota bacterium]